MNTDRQGFRHNLPTARTSLGGVAWVNEYDATASFFRFARGELYELMSGNIPDAFVQASVRAVFHVDNVQLLKGDKLIFVDQLARFFMRKVAAAIGNALVDVVDDPLALAILGRPLCLFRQAALCFRQGFLVLTKETGIVNRVAIAQGGKVGQTHIDTNHLVCEW